MKTAINATFRAVKTSCTRLPSATSKPCSTVIAAISPMAPNRSGIPGTTVPRYFSNRSAWLAIGAENPAHKDTHPDSAPSMG